MPKFMEIFSKHLGQFLIHLFFLPNLRKTLWLLINTTRTEIFRGHIRRPRRFGLSQTKEILLHKLPLAKFCQVLALSIYFLKNCINQYLSKNFRFSEPRLCRLHKFNYCSTLIISPYSYTQEETKNHDDCCYLQ